MAIREGKWRCPSCSGVNRGAAMSCSGCGATRDDSVQFFLDDDAGEVTDRALIARAESGADWICSRCSNTNPATRPSCESCGSARDEGRARSSGHVIPVHPQVASYGPPAQGFALPRGCGWLAAVFAAIAFACLACGLLGRSRVAVRSSPDIASGAFETATATAVAPPAPIYTGIAAVTTVSWARSIDVDALTPVSKTCWGSPPAGARDVSRHQEPHGTRHVQRGTHTVTTTERVQTGTKTIVTGRKSLGNGFFKDVTATQPVYGTRTRTHEEPIWVDEPILEDHCTYTVDEWRHARTATADGGVDPAYWPEASCATGERESGRRQSYTVRLEVEWQGTALSVEVGSFEELSGYPRGSRWNLEWQEGGSVRVLGAASLETPSGAAGTNAAIAPVTTAEPLPPPGTSDEEHRGG